MSDANRAAKNPANFSRLTIEQRRVIASAGGRAAHANGRAHRFTSEEARSAGKRGGSIVMRADVMVLSGLSNRPAQASYMDIDTLIEIYSQPWPLMTWWDKALAPSQAPIPAFKQ